MWKLLAQLLRSRLLSQTAGSLERSRCLVWRAWGSERGSHQWMHFRGFSLAAVLDWNTTTPQDATAKALLWVFINWWEPKIKCPQQWMYCPVKNSLIKWSSVDWQGTPNVTALCRQIWRYLLTRGLWRQQELRFRKTRPSPDSFGVAKQCFCLWLTWGWPVLEGKGFLL